MLNFTLAMSLKKSFFFKIKHYSISVMHYQHSLNGNQQKNEHILSLLDHLLQIVQSQINKTKKHHNNDRFEDKPHGKIIEVLIDLFSMQL